MNRVIEFIQIYNQVSATLSTMTGCDRGTPFSQMVERASQRNSAVRAYRWELKEYAELRNAVVHYSKFPTEVIAEPTEKAVAEFRELVQRIVAPQRLIPRFQKEIRCFCPDDTLILALLSKIASCIPAMNRKRRSLQTSPTSRRKIKSKTNSWSLRLRR